MPTRISMLGTLLELGGFWVLRERLLCLREFLWALLGLDGGCEYKVSDPYWNCCEIFANAPNIDARVGLKTHIADLRPIRDSILV